MKASLVTDKQAAVLAVGVLLVGFVAYRKARRVVSDNIHHINPVDDRNAANRAAESLWTKVTGIEEGPGIWVANKRHPTVPISEQGASFE